MCSQGQERLICVGVVVDTFAEISSFHIVFLAYLYMICYSDVILLFSYVTMLHLLREIICVDYDDKMCDSHLVILSRISKKSKMFLQS